MNSKKIVPAGVSKRTTRATLLTILVFLGAGCATNRTVTIGTKPIDALIRIDGQERGHGPITEQFTFQNATQTHWVTGSRKGFKDNVVTLTRDWDKKELMIELKPQTRTVKLNVLPVPALVSIDGKPVSDTPVSEISKELEFTVDLKTNQWIEHTVVAERPNYQPARATLRWEDASPNYVLNLDAMRKTLSVTTDPPGAEVYVDHQKIGTSPIAQSESIDFQVDPDTNDFVPRKLRAEKPGYDPVEIPLSWDGGKTDYRIDFKPKTKKITIISDPPGALVKIEGKEIAPDASGNITATLQFPPINEKGDLTTYTAWLSKKTADSEWEPLNVPIAWENGRTEYRVQLKEILTRDVQLLDPSMRRTDNGWEMQPEWVRTIAMKDLTEGAGATSPQQVTQLAKGTQLGSLAISPDGSQLLYTVLVAGTSPGDFRSQMQVIRTDGSGGADFISDGKSLDIMPSYTPGGEQIIFSSNRSGKRLNVWSMSAVGAPGVTRLTSGDTNDLWPSIDSDPKPRLFYQAMVDTRSDPRIYMTQLGTIFMTDLTNVAGTQPRISPKNDAVLFAAVNEKTGKRDIYRMKDSGGVPDNITNTPDADEFGATWSKDGSRVVFTSDRATDSDGRHNYDIWMIDLSKPGQPIQITTNASQDDCPVFDLTGTMVYFRSNRGGQWQIWKLPIPRRE